jgi:hypothetical protein
MHVKLLLLTAACWTPIGIAFITVLLFYPTSGNASFSSSLRVDVWCVVKASTADSIYLNVVIGLASLAGLMHGFTETACPANWNIILLGDGCLLAVDGLASCSDKW